MEEIYVKTLIIFFIKIFCEFVKSICLEYFAN